MSWREEFSADHEVPALLDFLASKKVIEDFSWHNDVSPSFGFIRQDGTTEIRLWVHHPLTKFRETGEETKRFYVVTGEATTSPDAEWGTDELQDALGILFRELGKYWRGREHNPKWEDPDEYLWELIEEWKESFR